MNLKKQIKKLHSHLNRPGEIDFQVTLTINRQVQYVHTGYVLFKNKIKSMTDHEHHILQYLGVTLIRNTKVRMPMLF
jgi:hypothetical protein